MAAERCLPPPRPPSHLMAPKEPCAKYQYVLTSSGPRIVPVRDSVSREEESPADYNAGGYLPVKINDVFKDGRYLVVRKLGYALFSLARPFLTLSAAGATSLPSGSSMIPSPSLVLSLCSPFHSFPANRAIRPSRSSSLLLAMLIQPATR